MIIVKATQDSEAGVMPGEQLLSTMQKYHEELVKSGVLVDASGLKPSSKGWRIKYSGDKRTFVDGPFAETKELVAGYTIINVKSREEAIELTKRFPNPAVDGKTGDQTKLQELYARLVTKTGPYEDQMFVDQLSNVNREINEADQKVGASAFERFNQLMKEWTALKTDAETALR